MDACNNPNKQADNRLRLEKDRCCLSEIMTTTSNNKKQTSRDSGNAVASVVLFMHDLLRKKRKEEGVNFENAKIHPIKVHRHHAALLTS